MSSTIYSVGMARGEITPEQPVWMGGYAFRDHANEGVLSPLWAKALAIYADGVPALLVVTVDLVGLSADLVERIQKGIESGYGVGEEQLVIFSSHTHSAPLAWSDIPLAPADEEECRKMETYGDWLVERVVAVAGEALSNNEPAELEFAQGVAGVGVNRRRERKHCRHYPGPVDHDVPVLRVKGGDGACRAILFGYACHATSLSLYDISADWPGYACSAIEENVPGAMAFYIPGCGADINPLPRMVPGQEVALSQRYGQTLAAAVIQALRGGVRKLSGPLSVRKGSVHLAFDHIPSDQEIEAVESRNAPCDALWAKRLKRQQLSGGIPERIEYPVQVIRLGSDLLWIAFCGEVVVDYALTLKGLHGWENTWVSAYAGPFDYGYIPSRRIWLEGGYEGGESHIAFGLPSRYRGDIEERILGLTRELL